VNDILNEQSAAGTSLKALFGYNGNPALLEVIAHGAYLIVVSMAASRGNRTVLSVAEAG
jgi:high-affinity iron transporter